MIPAVQVLAPLMMSSSPGLIFAYVAAMVAMAGREAASTLPWLYDGLTRDCLVSAAGGAGAAALAGIIVVIQPSERTDPPHTHRRRAL